jgi:hypothetical protein
MPAASPPLRVTLNAHRLTAEPGLDMDAPATVQGFLKRRSAAGRQLLVRPRVSEGLAEPRPCGLYGLGTALYVSPPLTQQRAPASSLCRKLTVVSLLMLRTFNAPALCVGALHKLSSLCHALRTLCIVRARCALSVCCVSPPRLSLCVSSLYSPSSLAPRVCAGGRRPHESVRGRGAVQQPVALGAPVALLSPLRRGATRGRAHRAAKVYIFCPRASSVCARMCAECGSIRVEAAATTTTTTTTARAATATGGGGGVRQWTGIRREIRSQIKQLDRGGVCGGVRAALRQSDSRGRAVAPDMAQRAAVSYA